MKKKELKKIITEFIVNYDTLEMMFEAANNITGMDRDSPLGRAVDSIILSNIDLIDGLSDCKTGWLSWYVLENGCGSFGIKAGHNNFEMREIYTVDQLVDLMLSE